MNRLLRQFWCGLRGHTRREYYIGADGLYHARCKCCKIELTMTHKGTLFID